MTILSVGIVPVRKVQKHYEYLLLRCFKYWDFPKGETETGEDPLTTALRELKEETGIDQAEFVWGNEFYETEVYSKGKIARYYLAEISETGPITLLPNPENGIIEHHEYRWVTHAEGMQLANPRIQKVFEWAHNQLKNEACH